MAKDVESNRFEESGNYMDKVQDEVLETGSGPNGEKIETAQTRTELDTSTLDDTPELVEEAKPVELIYIPRKDFEARINENEFTFRKGVRHRVSRDLANMLLEDDEKGYILEG